MKKSFSSALLLAFLLPGAAWAAELSWTNAGTGDWVVPGNWDAEPPAAPTAADQAVIGLGHARVDSGAEASEVSINGTGALTVQQGGVLVVGSAVSLGGGGNATVTGAGSTITTPQLVVGVSGTTSLTIADGGTVSVSSGTAIVGQGGAVAALNIGSPDLFSPTTGGTLDAETVVLDSSLSTMNFNHTGAVTFSADISGAGQVVKRGSGTTTLTGVSSYTGGTVIEAGTLIVDGFIGDVVVQAGTTLQGDGDVKDIDLQAGSKLVPIDCFDGDELSWHSGATMEFGLGGGGGANILEVQNLQKISGGSSFVFTFTDAGWEPGEEYLLIAFNDTNFAEGDFSFVTGGGVNGFFTMDETTLRFTLTAVPEPSVMVMLGAGWAALGLLRRRRME